MSQHLLRAGMTAAILLLFYLQLMSYRMQSSSGGEFASLVLIACYWFVTIAGVFHFATAVTEEKEEQTLPLLRMTGAGPFSILLGKTGPRVTAISLFLMVGCPFLILAVSLGGVLTVGILSALFALLVYALTLSQMGALASVLSRNGKNAIAVTWLFWGALELNPLLVELAKGVTPPGPLNDFANGPLSNLPDYSLIYNLSSTLYTVSDAAAVDAGLLATAEHYLSRLFSGRVCFQLILSAILFSMSWLGFDWFADRHAIPIAKNVRDRRKSSQRVYSQAVAWKTYQHLTGGTFWLVIRIVVPPVLLYATFITGQLLDAGRIDWDMTHGIILSLGMLLFFINATRQCGQLLTSEMSQQTLASLVILPQSTGLLLLQMVTGLLPAIFAGASTMLVAGICISSREPIDNIGTLLLEPGFYSVGAAFVLILHLQVLFSTWFRYGAMPLATFVVIASHILIFTMAVVSMPFMGTLLPIGLVIGSVVTCAAVQRAIIARIKELVG